MDQLVSAGPAPQAPHETMDMGQDESPPDRRLNRPWSYLFWFHFGVTLFLARRQMRALRRGRPGSLGFERSLLAQLGLWLWSAGLEPQRIDGSAQSQSKPGKLEGRNPR